MEWLNLLERKSVRWWLAGLTTALCLTLWCPSWATAKVSESTKAEIAEAINPSNDLDTTKTIHFDTARKSVEEPGSESSDSLSEQGNFLDSMDEILKNFWHIGLWTILLVYLRKKKKWIMDFFNDKEWGARFKNRDKKDDVVDTEVTQLLNDEKGIKVAQILQEINTIREENEQDVIKITEELLDTIILHMNNFEQTVKEFRSVGDDLGWNIDRNRKAHYKLFKGEKLKKMNVKELLDITRSRKNTGCLYPHIDELIIKHYELIWWRFWDQFTEIERIMLDNFRIGFSDDIFRKIFKIRFNENYDWFYRSTYYDDFLTQKTLYDIAQAWENDEVFWVELEIVKWKKWWPKFQIPFKWWHFVRWWSGESMGKWEKRTVIIATNVDRNPIFRLRINKSKLVKKWQKIWGWNYDSYNRVLFDNGKVYLTGDDVKRWPIDITEYLY